MPEETNEPQPKKVGCPLTLAGDELHEGDCVTLQGKIVRAVDSLGNIGQNLTVELDAVAGESCVTVSCNGKHAARVESPAS